MKLRRRFHRSGIRQGYPHGCRRQPPITGQYNLPVSQVSRLPGIPNSKFVKPNFFHFQ